MGQTLTRDDFVQAGQQLRVPPWAIEAVTQVEAPRGGFLPSGRVVILFEGHHFHRLTHGRYDAAWPAISYPHWDSNKYLGGEREYTRFNRAFNLEPEAAMQSCSWGRFQIMGFNHEECGFAHVGPMVDAMKVSEGAQLAVFCTFLKVNGLDAALRRCDFVTFARRYNGPRYDRNAYHLKLRDAYRACQAKWSTDGG